MTVTALLEEIVVEYLKQNDDDCFYSVWVNCLPHLNEWRLRL
jgi:hypothetical protein